MGIRICKADKI